MCLSFCSISGGRLPWWYIATRSWFPKTSWTEPSPPGAIRTPSSTFGPSGIWWAFMPLTLLNIQPPFRDGNGLFVGRFLLPH